MSEEDSTGKSDLFIVGEPVSHPPVLRDKYTPKNEPEQGILDRQWPFEDVRLVTCTDRFLKADGIGPVGVTEGNPDRLPSGVLRHEETHIMYEPTPKEAAALKALMMSSWYDFYEPPQSFLNWQPAIEQERLAERVDQPVFWAFRLSNDMIYLPKLGKKARLQSRSRNRARQFQVVIIDAASNPMVASSEIKGMVIQSYKRRSIAFDRGLKSVTCPTLPSRRRTQIRGQR